MENRIQSHQNIRRAETRNAWKSMGAMLVLTGLSACGGGTQDQAETPVTTSTNAVSTEAFDQTPEGQEQAAGKLAVAHVAGAANGQVAVPFTDPLASNETVSSVKICAGWYVDSITLTSNLGAHATHGGSGGSCQSFTLNAGEQILRLTGNADGHVIYSLGLVTSQGRTFGPVGGTGGTPGTAFSLTVAGGATGKFLGLTGFNGSYNGSNVLLQLGLIGEGNGGDGGLPFIDRMKADETVNAVTVCYRPNAYVQKIQLQTNLGLLPAHGSDWPGESCNTTQLAAGEYITQISGAADAYVNSFAYSTSTGRTIGPFGGSGGTPFQQTVNYGSFVGLFGRSGSWIDQVGLMTPMAGDSGAELYADQLPAGNTINMVQVCVGNAYGTRVVQSLQAFYNNGASKLPLHGGLFRSGDTVCSNLNFNSGEFITEMSGHYGGAMDSISFLTNQGRTFGPYGGAGGPNAYVIRNPNTDQFLGFFGRATQTGQADNGTIHSVDFAAPDVYQAASAPTTTAATQGWWDSVVSWPVIAIHTAILPDGRLMSYGTDAAGAQGAQYIYDVWTPSAGTGAASHMTLPNTIGTDLFCGGQTLLSNGMLVFAGGDARAKGYNAGIFNTTLFNPSSNQLENDATLNYARWYVSQTTLPSGRVLASGGTNQNYQSSITPEVYTPGKGWKPLTGMTNANAFAVSYPRTFTTSYTKPGDQVYSITTSGNGHIYRLNPDDNNGNGAVYDTGVDLGGAYSWTNPTAMIGTNQVLTARDDGSTVIVQFPSAEGQAPTVTAAGKMRQSRAWGNFTILPTGDVLATNGSTQANVLTGIGYQAELWSAKTKTWRTVATEMRPRLYHSNSILLPDGRVLSSGGGAGGLAPLDNLNAQLYSPPYLFTSSGAAAVRPTINALPSQVLGYRNALFTVNTPNAAAIQRVTLLRLGSMTHSFNTEQRFLELSFTHKDANNLSVQSPWDWYVAPPGYYMLSIIDGNGVPSVSKIIRLAQQ